LQTCLKVYEDDNTSMTLLLGSRMALGMHKSQFILWTSVNYISQSEQSFVGGIFCESL